MPEKLLVAVGPSPHAGSLIRWTRRAAARLQCPWIAVSVETGALLDEGSRERLTEYLLLARRLGAETVSVGASTVFAGIAQAAAEHHATQIIVGKPDRRGWWRNLRSAWQLHRFAAAGAWADLHIVRVPEAEAPRPGRPTGFETSAGAGPHRGFGEAFLAVGGVTLTGVLLLDRIGYQSVALLYLLAVLVLGLRLTRGPMLAAAALSALAWDFLFIPPRFTLVVDKLHDLILLTLFFLVALVTGQITARLRRQERLVRERERRTALLQRLTEILSHNADPGQALQQGLSLIGEALGADAALYYRRNPAELLTDPAPGSSFQPDTRERAVAMWVYQQGQPAGRFTDTLREASSTWFPLRTAAMTSGVLGLKLPRTLNPGERTLLGTLSSQLATALEKEHFLNAIRQAELTEQSNRLHKTLLDSVSHELKTPLAVLRAACERLAAAAPAGISGLAAEIAQAERRLNRVVDQLLDLTRLESGMLKPRLEWCETAELLTTTAAGAGLTGGRIAWRLPAGNPLVRTDPGMMETILSNLLRNAASHQPQGPPLEAGASLENGTLHLTVRDHGPGLPAGAEGQVFDKFYRAPDAPAGGLGLGLSIVQGLVRALGGSITAGNAPGGGAVFTAAIPMESRPSLPDDAA